MIIYNVDGHVIDHNKNENAEWELAERYVKSDDIVLELGARFGSTSVVVNKIVNGSNIVCVEPDETTWETLERNKLVNNCDFNIIKGAISKNKLNLKFGGYATFTYNDDNGNVNTFDLWDIQKEFNLKFNVLIADCEGCLSVFLEHYIDFFKQLRLVIVETDRADTCNYQKLFDILNSNGLTCEVSGFHTVYLKK